MQGACGKYAKFPNTDAHPYDERQKFYSDLGDLLGQGAGHGPKFVFGDMNARVLRQLAHEQEIVGPGAFGSDRAEIHELSNRHLLIELCHRRAMSLASTMRAGRPEELATYRDLGTKPTDEVVYPAYAQLDYVIAERSWQHCVTGTVVHRFAQLASHHFLLVAVLHVDVPKVKGTAKTHKVDKTALASEEVVVQFVSNFEAAMTDLISKEGDCSDPNAWQAWFEAAFGEAQQVLPTTAAVASKPWISSSTLRLIDERNAAQAVGDRPAVSRLSSRVRASAKQDRRNWLDALVESGEWSRVRQLRKGFAPKPSKLKNAAGTPVDSTQRAETLAEYYESVQWRVRPDSLPDGAAVLGPELNVNIGPIMHSEVIAAAKRLKNNKACGPDQVPAEFWRAVLTADSEAGRWATEFCNTCWLCKKVPLQWHKARVAAIFKKGVHDDPANYRPISLLCVIYKLFASIVLERLKGAGAEDRLWATQFGFKSGTGTRDALFLARRMLEATWQTKGGKLMFLALDWAKAFDSVSPALACQLTPWRW